jgi:protein-tyrosine phosphatase
VLYFPGISHLDELPDLCLQNTNVLLLEMPFIRWTEAMIREVKDLARSRRVIVLLAHIDRYYYRQRRSVWDEFLQEDILIQANAEFFLGTWTKRRALHLLKNGTIHLLGSDCHNMTTRPPHLKEAATVIEQALGPGVLRSMDALGRDLLGDYIRR